MRVFYLDGNVIQTSYKCPAGMADCMAFDYLNSVPNLNVHYNMCNAISTDIVIGPVLPPFNTATVILEIKKCCKNCPMGTQMKQRAR